MPILPENVLCLRRVSELPGGAAVSSDAADSAVAVAAAADSTPADSAPADAAPADSAPADAAPADAAPADAAPADSAITDADSASTSVACERIGIDVQNPRTRQWRIRYTRFVRVHLGEIVRWRNKPSLGDGKQEEVSLGRVRTHIWRRRRLRRIGVHQNHSKIIQQQQSHGSVGVQRSARIFDG